jgi:hypothetical protein
MNIFKYLSGRKDEVYLSQNAIPLRNVAAGTKSGDAVPYEQALKVAADGTTQATNIAFTGTNTHSGPETFSNATGATTDVLTPRTSGAGTSFKVPAGIKTTTPIAATAILSGGTYGLSKADGLALALPALATVDIGTKFKFHILTSCTSVGYVISTGEAGDVFVGSLWCTIANPDAANDMELNLASGTVNTLTLGATTACGLAGGWFEVTAISATQWAISGICLGSGTLASNLFSTV